MKLAPEIIRLSKIAAGPVPPAAAPAPGPTGAAKRPPLPTDLTGTMFYYMKGHATGANMRDDPTALRLQGFLKRMSPEDQKKFWDMYNARLNGRGGGRGGYTPTYRNIFRPQAANGGGRNDEWNNYDMMYRGYSMAHNWATEADQRAKSAQRGKANLEKAQKRREENMRNYRKWDDVGTWFGPSADEVKRMGDSTYKRNYSWRNDPISYIPGGVLWTGAKHIYKNYLQDFFDHRARNQ